MLAIQRQNNLIQKMIKLPDGRVAIVVFEVYLENGTPKARAVCGKILGSDICGEEVLQIHGQVEKYSVLPILSPFFADIQNIIKDFTFVTSQPARAPNYC